MRALRLCLLLSLSCLSAATVHADEADLDPSFAPPIGVVRHDLAAQGTADELVGVEMLGDGSRVLFGRVNPGEAGSDWGALRLLPDGRRDASFGNNGYVWFSAGGRGRLRGSALTQDGALLLAGSLPSGNEPVQVGAMARFSAGGQFDVFFRATPTLRSLGADSVGDVVEHPDRTLFVVTSLPGAGGTRDLAIVALAPDGTLETRFGEQGAVRVDFGRGGLASEDRGVSILFEPETDRLVAAGEAVLADGTPHLVAFRVSAANGVRDLAFEKRVRGDLVGFDTCPDPAVAERIELRSLLRVSHGRYLLAAEVGNAGCADGDTSGWALLRLTQDGTPDRSFTGDGRQLLRVSDIATMHALGGAALDPHGDLVLTGQAGRVIDRNAVPRLAVARLRRDGSPDPDFSGDGIATHDLASAQPGDRGGAVVLDGSRVLVYGTSNAGSDDYTAVRLMAQPLMTDSFE